MKKNITLTINDKKVTVPAGTTIMQAAYKLGIDIPRLCFLKDINETSACRICMVEIEGVKTLKNSCTIEATDNMVVRTNTKRVRDSIKYNLELLAANHKFECWNCSREHNCELLDLMRKFNVTNRLGETGNFERKVPITNITNSIVIDNSKCILCGRCVSTCEKLTGKGILNFNNRGFETYVSTALNHDMDNSGCIYCGKCIQACPVGAISERNHIHEVMELLEDDSVYKVVQIAPAVRAALGEEFGYPIGTNVEGQLYRALDELGFDDITDTNFSADLTILEESHELVERLTKFLNNEETALPMFTSCSPGWIRYLEIYYPEFIPNLSTCKSPQQMLGSLIKNYYSKKINVPKEKIKVVSIMPCIAKKSEAAREELSSDGYPDVDIVLTTRELARLIKIKNIDFLSLKPLAPKSPLAQYTGAGVIFGATGGVMEAALRTVKETFELENRETIDIKEVRGAGEGIKEFSIDLNGNTLNFAVVHGAVNFPQVLEQIKNKEKDYCFVEFMACTGGCINGGGQPIVSAKVMDNVDVRELRAKALYNIDKSKPLRHSERNEEVLKLYDEFLDTPGSDVAHKYLHTTYSPKSRYDE